MNLKDVERDARLYATQLAQMIAERANQYPAEEVVAFAGAAASMVFQTISLSILINHHDPGSFSGEDAIRLLYENAEVDAVARWYKPDLKERIENIDHPKQISLNFIR